MIENMHLCRESRFTVYAIVFIVAVLLADVTINSASFTFEFISTVMTMLSHMSNGMFPEVSI